MEIKLDPFGEEENGTVESHVIIVRNGRTVEITRWQVDFDTDLLGRVPKDAENENDGMIDLGEISDLDLLREILKEAQLHP